MENSFEKDGIVFFDKYFEVDYVDWIPKHLDCDSIITKESNGSEKICIVCYSTSEKYNQSLRELRDRKYPDHIILRGMGHEEVNCID